MCDDVWLPSVDLCMGVVLQKLRGPPEACRKIARGGGLVRGIKCASHSACSEIPILLQNVVVAVVIVVIVFDDKARRKGTVVVLLAGRSLLGDEGISIVPVAARVREQTPEGNVRRALFQDALRMPKVGGDDDVVVVVADFIGLVHLRRSSSSGSKLRGPRIVLGNDVQRPGVSEGPLVVPLHGGASRRTRGTDHLCGRTDGKCGHRSSRGLLGDACSAHHFAAECGCLRSRYRRGLMAVVIRTIVATKQGTAATQPRWRSMYDHCQCTALV